jgi:hypothetical protein
MKQANHFAGMMARKRGVDGCWRRWLRRVSLLIILASVTIGSGVFVLWEIPPVNLAEGIFWQPNRKYLQPEGIWNQIGIHTLVVQWTVTDGRAWFPSSNLPQWEPQIDWAHIRDAPWADKTIVGLAGDFQLPHARMDAQQLAALSPDIVTSIPLKNPIAWYAPVEISPGWRNPHAIRAYLAGLPRPLWVTIYGGNKMTPTELVSWVRSWLPPGVGVLHQDGVGVGRETPVQAARRTRALETALGRSHVGIILEAFQQRPQGRFVSAGVWRVAKQLRTYKGLHIYIFSAQTLGTVDVLLLKLFGLLGLA